MTRRVAIVSDANFYVGPALAKLLASRDHDLALGDASDELVAEVEAAGATVVNVPGVGRLGEGDAEQLVVAATERCLPYTMHAHVRDYVLENDTYNGVAVGAGLIDFEKILPLLARAGGGEDIVFSMEVDTDDRDEDQCAQDSYQYLKDWCLKNGHGEHIRR